MKRRQIPTFLKIRLGYPLEDRLREYLSNELWTFLWFETYDKLKPHVVDVKMKRLV